MVEAGGVEGVARGVTFCVPFCGWLTSRHVYFAPPRGTVEPEASNVTGFWSAVKLSKPSIGPAAEKTLTNPTYMLSGPKTALCTICPATPTRPKAKCSGASGSNDARPTNWSGYCPASHFTPW